MNDMHMCVGECVMRSEIVITYVSQFMYIKLSNCQCVFILFGTHTLKYLERQDQMASDLKIFEIVKNSNVEHSFGRELDLPRTWRLIVFLYNELSKQFY